MCANGLRARKRAGRRRLFHSVCFSSRYHVPSMRISLGLAALGLAALAFAVEALPSPQSSGPSAGQASRAPGSFVDVTSSLGVRFQYRAAHTSRKYLPETMGAGVALFDYDNDGRLDLFVVNGAPLADPTAKGTIPEKSGPIYWNRLFHQKADGTFED